MGCRVGHDGEDATISELAVGELRPVSVVLCSYVADGWDLLAYGPPLSVVVGALDMVHLEAELDLKLIFFIYFHNFECKLQKFISGVSKWGDPNFSRFIMKFSV